MTSKEVLDDMRQDELLQAVKSLINDIESMQSRTSSDWFGRFSEWEDSLDGALVEWPNLAISLAAVKALIDPPTIEGDLAATKVIS